MEALFKAFNLILTVANSLEQARLIWASYEGKLRTMMEEGRDPTEAEWAELFALVENQSNELQK